MSTAVRLRGQDRGGAGEGVIGVFLTSSPTQLHISTPASTRGLCSLSPSCDNSRCSPCRHQGWADCSWVTSSVPTTRPGDPAHDSASIQLNVQGTKVATASTKDNQVFDTVSGAIITELARRGSQPAINIQRLF